MGVSTSWESRKEVVRSIVRGCCISSERITTVGRWRLKYIQLWVRLCAVQPSYETKSL